MGTGAVAADLSGAGPTPSRGVRRRPAGRLVFTTIMVVALVVVSALIGTLQGGLIARHVRETFGYDIENLRHGRVWVVVTAEVLTQSRPHLLSCLAMMLAWLLPLEWLAGTWAAATAYVAATLIGTAISALLAWLLEYLRDWSPSPNMVTEADVGSSVGGWGCAGALALVLYRRGGWNRAIGIGLLIGGWAYLAYSLIVKTGVADVAHPIGMATGSVVALLLYRPPPAGEPG